MNCPYCERPLTEINYYGELLVGCLECNHWGRPEDVAASQFGEHPEDCRVRR